MSSRKFRNEKKAIIYFTKKIREEINLNGGVPIKKTQLGAIFNESPEDIEQFIRNQYSPQPIRNFLDAHPKIFWIYGSGIDIEVDVASEMTISNYTNLLNRDSLAWDKTKENDTSSKQHEKDSIYYFFNVMKVRALKDRSDCHGVVHKKDFYQIFREAPNHIQNFVLNEFASFDQFITHHEEIFPESLSGASVRVKPQTKVLKYINKLCKNSDVTKDQQSQSSSSSTSTSPCPNLRVNSNFGSVSNSKPFNVQDFLIPTLNTNKSSNTGSSNINHVTQSKNVDKIRDTDQIMTTDISKQLVKNNIKFQKFKTSVRNSAKSSDSLHIIPKFESKPGFNCSSSVVTFVEANYAYDDLLQDLFSKSILDYESNSNEELKNMVKKQHIECQTTSSGPILSLQFHQ